MSSSLLFCFSPQPGSICLTSGWVVLQRFVDGRGRSCQCRVKWDKSRKAKHSTGKGALKWGKMRERKCIAIFVQWKDLSICLGLVHNLFCGCTDVLVSLCIMSRHSDGWSIWVFLEVLSPVCVLHSFCSEWSYVFWEHGFSSTSTFCAKGCPWRRMWECRSMAA